MQNRVSELEDVVLPPIDVKKLQLRLQGSVAVQVNAGPLAYATAFLEPQRSTQYPSDKVEDLKEVFRYLIPVQFSLQKKNLNFISYLQRICRHLQYSFTSQRSNDFIRPTRISFSLAG